MSWGAPKKIEIHIYQHGGSGNDGLAELKGLIQTLTGKVDAIVATLADFEAGFARIDTATSNIAADIKRLVGQLQSGLSDADEAIALEKLLAHATALEGIAASVEDPVPPPTPTP